MRGGPDDDYIKTEHLSTVFVILPRGSDKEFLASYESMSEGVVPMSAQKFADLDDKDGNSIWRVILFNTGVDAFKKNCREKRFAPRDFEFSEEAYKKLIAQREQVHEAVNRQFANVKGLYQAAWSDAMVAWMHIKAMRIFVESVLRFGMPPRFAAFTVVPRGNSSHARKALADVLGKRALEHSAGPCSADKMAEAALEDGEEYFPYVSFSFQPFTANQRS
jgi:V-type H+-transporting ATPase subunit C